MEEPSNQELNIENILNISKCAICKETLTDNICGVKMFLDEEGRLRGAHEECFINKYEQVDGD